ncbi:chemotaxis protein MotB [Desulfitispora alkaliphila]|uniref:OmpA family protein n=1 Tax=Desulfitispora alkaliphila TaxID=622674 RepID=UPI003D212C3B
MAAKRKRRISEKKGVDPWIVTYSDTITLVLCFFILLFSFSVIDPVKFNQVIASVRGSFGVIDGGKTIVVDSAETLGNIEEDISQLIEQIEAEQAQLQDMAKELEAYIEEQGLEDSAVTVISERGVTIRLLEDVLFDIGRADLKPQAEEILAKVGSAIVGMDNSVRVEGYTCDIPISTRQFPSNWELSTARSTTVVRFFEDKDIEGNRLTAVGYGEYRPLEENDSEENRRQNRRVDIVILSNLTD